MDLRVKFNSTEYNLISDSSNALEDLVKLKFTSRESQISYFTVDFTGKTTSDLPIIMQEIQIIDKDDSDNVIYTGYIESMELPEFRHGNEKLRLRLVSYSPLILASKKTISINASYEPLNDIVEDILAPLIEEGFTIEENNLSDQKATIKANMDTVENLMNVLSNKYNFAWFIDQDKKIYIKPVVQIQEQKSVLTINDDYIANLDDSIAVNFLPKISSTDYANVINIKNTKVLTEETLVDEIDYNDYETVMLPYAISISPTSAAKSAQEGVLGSLFSSGYFVIFTIDFGVATYVPGITYDGSTKEVTMDEPIGIDGQDAFPDKRILLILDGFNGTNILGFKCKSAATYSLYATTVLLPRSTILINNEEVIKGKDKISNTGKVEKTIDLRGKYFTELELIQYAQSQIERTPKQTEKVDLKIKGKAGSALSNVIDVFQPWAKITFDFPDYLTEGDFIITDISQNIAVGDTITYNIKMRNVNLIESYLDSFRVELEEIPDEEISDTIYSVYQQGDIIVENKSTLVDGVDIDES